MEKSPLNLLQEIYADDSWKIMVCCMFLNQTSRKQVDKVRDLFFKRYPDARSCAEADPEEMKEIIKSLGFKNRRTKSIMRMSEEWLGEWKDVKEVHGLGQYAQDSYDIFVLGKVIETTSDHVLEKWLDWKKNTID